MDTPAAVILDFDDTIVQTSKIRKPLFEATLSGFARVDEERLRRVLEWGTPFEAMVRRVIGDRFDEFLDLYLSRMALSAPMACSGVDLLLRAAAAEAVPVAILSSSHSRLIEHDLGALGLRNLISVILGSDSLPLQKPDPGLIDSVLARCGLPAHAREKTIYVGDGTLDYLTARGQVRFFAVISGTTPRERFLASGLDDKCIVDDLRGLSNKLFPDYAASS